MVVQIEAEPTEFVAQIVYLAQQSAGHFVAQALVQVAFPVKEPAFRAGHLPHQDGALGEWQPRDKAVAFRLGRAGGATPRTA